MIQMLEWSDNDFEVAIIKIPQEIRLNQIERYKVLVKK